MFQTGQSQHPETRDDTRESLILFRIRAIFHSTPGKEARFIPQRGTRLKPNTGLNYIIGPLEVAHLYTE